MSSYVILSRGWCYCAGAVWDGYKFSTVCTVCEFKDMEIFKGHTRTMIQ